MRTIKATLRLNGHGHEDEVYETVYVPLPNSVWNGIAPGWDDVDEYDYCWDYFLDTVVNNMHRDQRADWYIDSWEVYEPRFKIIDERSGGEMCQQ